MSQQLKQFENSLLTSEPVSIHTANHQPFLVPLTLLLAASPWFGAALAKNFKEGQEQTLRFPETDYNTVLAFLYWLFNGRQLHTATVTGHPGDDETSRLQLQDAKLFIFADMHLIPDLRDAAMQDLQNRLLLQYPNTQLVRTVFEGTATDSPLRQVILKEVVCGMRERAKGDQSAGFSTGELDKLMADVPGFSTALMEELAKHLAKLSWEQVSE